MKASSWIHATSLSAALALCGCGNQEPFGPPPDKARFAAMTFTERCAATERRAVPCASQLVTAELSILTGISYDDATKLSPDEHLSSDAAKGIHRTQCDGSKEYPDAVIACWQEGTCKAFATCVVRPRQTSNAPSP